eukprot:357706-Chlamydomonas_euryale.AAC.2
MWTRLLRAGHHPVRRHHAVHGDVRRGARRVGHGVPQRPFPLVSLASGKCGIYPLDNTRTGATCPGALVAAGKP